MHRVEFGWAEIGGRKGRSIGVGSSGRRDMIIVDKMGEVAAH